MGYKKMKKVILICLMGIMLQGCVAGFVIGAVVGSSYCGKRVDGSNSNPKCRDYRPDTKAEAKAKADKQLPSN